MPKKWIYLAVFVIAAFVVLFIYKRYYVAPALDPKALSLANLDGQAVSMKSFKGKKIVLCFSASWCANCWQELEAINAVREKELGDVEVIVISDEPLEKIRHFKEKSGFPFTFLKMQKQFSDIGINSIPTSYIVNTRLEIKKETVGYLDWRDPSTLQHLKKLME